MPDDVLSLSDAAHDEESAAGDGQQGQGSEQPEFPAAFLRDVLDFIHQVRCVEPLLDVCEQVVCHVK